MSVKNIAQTLGLKEWQVSNVIRLLEQDATVPFIARYRKEKTGDLDEVQIRLVEDARQKMIDLEKRRNFILVQVESLGKLTPELKQSILQAQDADTLEDIYLPYKAKKRTRADVAREAGVEPLAAAIFAQKGDQWMHQWQRLVKDQTLGIERSLILARDIIAEWISEDASLRGKFRAMFEQKGVLHCKVTRGKSKMPEAMKYQDYFDYSENLMQVPSHRFLAMQRGEAEGWLKLYASPDEDSVHYLLKKHCLKGYGETQEQIKIAMSDAWERLIQPSIETEFFARLKERSDEDAIRVFAENVKQLLLAAPLGQKRILAVDPGFRTGCKAVVLGDTGELLVHTNIFPHEPQRDIKGATELVKKWISEYQPEAIAVGNGTAGRETQEFFQNIPNLGVPVFMVNESGASVYSASDIAREEFPSHDVTVRGAVSIGRRLMDPLAELVKIEPKSIGVGQYQHDVNQSLLKKRLDSVVESAVNAVGINLNTASPWLLSHVSGLGQVLAKNIVEYRQKNGSFQSREELKKVPRLGDKAFEQCAGFLRIRGGQNPLDESAVHPERYGLVKRMASDANLTVSELIKQPEKIKSIRPEPYINETEGIGLPTIQDILKELQKPGLDPRGEFVSVGFSDSVRSIEDLESGMELNGIITNIVDFGAFADIGVKQDGLIHISQISQKFIKHPMEVVSLGQHVKVRVMDVDIPRKRISLTMKFQ